MKKLLLILICILSISSIILISRFTPTGQGYTSRYQNALVRYPGISLKGSDTAWITQIFEQSFNAILSEKSSAIIKKNYSEKLYFNDTMSIFYQSSELAKHFDKLKKKLDSIDVSIEKVLIDPNNAQDIFLYWHMNYTLVFWGKSNSFSSYGLSHVRFNKNKQIIFQQDFWDTNNGLYHQLPYIGPVFKKLTPVRTSNVHKTVFTSH